MAVKGGKMKEKVEELRKRLLKEDYRDDLRELTSLVFNINDRLVKITKRVDNLEKEVEGLKRRIR